MLSREAIQTIISSALKNLNDERGPDAQIAIGPDTRLFGSEATLDSLSLVSVIVDVEAALSEASGRDVSLTDDRAMNQAVSPFYDVNALTSYALALLSEPA